MFNEVYRNLLNKLSDGEEAFLLTTMKPLNSRKGGIGNKFLLVKNELDKDLSFVSENESLKEKIFDASESGLPRIAGDLENESVLIEPFFPKPRLVIFGGGHIAKPLVEFGAKVGFSTTVVDDRPSFANKGRFPEAEEVICDNFENTFNLLKLRPSDFVVIVTRGHRHDGVCLRNTLKFNPAYIGMIGSKRRVKIMKEELLKEGYAQEILAKVNAPIGLDISAVTPEEIAISIIAQVISYRRTKGNANDLRTNTKFNWPEFDRDVIEEISRESDIPRALVTIISSKGSVPRKAGAKMIVWLDGRLMGSIGGGCSEGEIINKARDIMRDKGYSIEHVDLTGDAAEDEGMVCGGIMDVLIEAF